MFRSFFSFCSFFLSELGCCRCSCSPAPFLFGHPGSHSTSNTWCCSYRGLFPVYRTTVFFLLIGLLLVGCCRCSFSPASPSSFFYLGSHSRPLSPLPANLLAFISMVYVHGLTRPNEQFGGDKGLRPSITCRIARFLSSVCVAYLVCQGGTPPCSNPLTALPRSTARWKNVCRVLSWLGLRCPCVASMFFSFDRLSRTKTAVLAIETLKYFSYRTRFLRRVRNACVWYKFRRWT